MFPISFKSKADRQRKYRQYLHQVDNGLKFDNIKQHAFEEAVWASDQANLLNLNQVPSTSSSQTQTDQTQTDPMLRSNPTFAVVPSVISNDVANRYTPISRDTQPIRPNVSGSLIDELKLKLVKNNLGLKSRHADISNNATPANEMASRKTIKSIYSENPTLASSQISPIRLDGSVDRSVYLDAKGDLITQSGKRSHKSDDEYNWDLTLNQITERVKHMKLDQSLTLLPPLPDSLSSSLHSPISSVESPPSSSESAIRISLNHESERKAALVFQAKIYLKNIFKDETHQAELSKAQLKFTGDDGKQHVISKSNVKNDNYKNDDTWLEIENIVKEYLSNHQKMTVADLHRRMGAFDESMSGRTDAESMASASTAMGKGLPRHRIGRRSLLRHELYKLVGEERIGNNNKANKRELSLLKHIYK